MKQNDQENKNSFFYSVYGRINFIQEFFYSLFFGLSSWPRLILEVFLRRNMGERYFSIASVLTVAVVLTVAPIVLAGRHTNMGPTVEENWLWYVFIVVFVVFGFIRWWEVITLPSVFELKRFSLSAGYSFPFLYEAGFSGRIISLVLEPAAAIAVGALLWLVGQELLGGLLIGCGVLYSLSYVAAGHRANNYVMNQLDDLICKTELNAAIADRKDPRQTRGFEFLGTVPKDAAARSRMAASLHDNSDAPEVS